MSVPTPAEKPTTPAVDVLAPHRDDGLLVLLAPRAVLTVPAVLLLAAALVLLALATTAATGALDLGPAWPDRKSVV